MRCSAGPSLSTSALPFGVTARLNGGLGKSSCGSVTACSFVHSVSLVSVCACFAPAPLSPAVQGLLKMAGDVYFPFLLANAAAFEKGEPTFSVTLLGRTYTQGAFRYQQRCLWDLREAYKKLDAATRERLDPLLKEAHCLAPLKG